MSDQRWNILPTGFNQVYGQSPYAQGADALGRALIGSGQAINQARSQFLAGQQQRRALAQQLVGQALTAPTSGQQVSLFNLAKHLHGQEFPDIFADLAAQQAPSPAMQQQQRTAAAAAGMPQASTPAPGAPAPSASPALQAAPPVPGEMTEGDYLAAQASKGQIPLMQRLAEGAYPITPVGDHYGQAQPVHSDVRNIGVDVHGRPVQMDMDWRPDAGLAASSQFGSDLEAFARTQHDYKRQLDQMSLRDQIADKYKGRYGEPVRDPSDVYPGDKGAFPLLEEPPGEFTATTKFLNNLPRSAATEAAALAAAPGAAPGAIAPGQESVTGVPTRLKQDHPRRDAFAANLSNPPNLKGIPSYAKQAIRSVWKNEQVAAAKGQAKAASERFKSLNETTSAVIKSLANSRFRIVQDHLIPFLSGNMSSEDLEIEPIPDRRGRGKGKSGRGMGRYRLKGAARSRIWNEIKEQQKQLAAAGVSSNNPASLNANNIQSFATLSVLNNRSLNDANGQAFTAMLPGGAMSKERIGEKPWRTLNELLANPGAYLWARANPQTMEGQLIGDLSNNLTQIEMTRIAQAGSQSFGSAEAERTKYRNAAREYTLLHKNLLRFRQQDFWLNIQQFSAGDLIKSGNFDQIAGHIVDVYLPMAKKAVNAKNALIPLAERVEPEELQDLNLSFTEDELVSREKAKTLIEAAYRRLGRPVPKGGEMNKAIYAIQAIPQYVGVE